MRTSPPLLVDARDAETLREWAESGLAGSAAARRARIVLLAAAGVGPSAIADELGCSKQTVITWRERYRVEGVAGLRDSPRSGRPATVDATAVISRTLAEPPERLGAVRWSTRLLAAELGISNAAVANIWRSWGVTPGVEGQVRLGTEPALDVPVAAVAGLYVAPPVRLLALRVGDCPAGPGRVVPVAQRPRIGARVAEIDSGRCAEGAVSHGLAAYLARLDDPGAHGGARAEPLGLLVEARSPLLDSWAAVRPWISLHVVPPELSWGRLVRVACVLAGASDAGGASVVALRKAVAAHAAGGPFEWTIT